MLANDARFEFPDRQLICHTPTLAGVRKYSTQRYTPEEKQVTVNLDASGDFYDIAIHDQGPGIPEIT